MTDPATPGLPLTGSRLGFGRTAEIFAWQPGTVLKLFHASAPPPFVTHEARIAQAVHAAGIPCPALIERVEVDGRLGIVYERIDGTSMLALMLRTPWRMLAYARQLAELQAGLHRARLPVDGDSQALPALRAILRSRIAGAERLPERFRAPALAALDPLPDGDSICHGDLHPDNILIDGARATIIDWPTAALGDPLADVARTHLLISSGTPVNSGPPAWLLSTMRRLVTGAYLRRYAALTGRSRESLVAGFTPWRVPVIAARFAETIEGEEPVLTRQLDALLTHRP